MALADDGAVVGSVSGGCIEDDLIARYSRAHGAVEDMPSGPPALVKYGVTADEAHRSIILLVQVLEALEHGVDRRLGCTDIASQLPAVGTVSAIAKKASQSTR